MSDRDLRKSTIKATEETKSREEARHSKQQLKKQRAVYSELIAEQEREIPESSDSQSSQAATGAEEIDRNIESDDEESSSDEYVDPLKAVKSPAKEPVATPKSGTTPSPSTWSTINQFFPEGCVRTPIIHPPLPTASGRSSNLSPRLASIVEDEVFEPPLEASTPAEHQSTVSTAMDDATFNPLIISVRREVFNVEQNIKGFTPAHVNLDFKEEITTRLKEIDTCNNVCQNKIYHVLVLLDENIPSDLDKINLLRKLADDTNSKVLTNSVQVREKLSELIKENPLTAAEKETRDREKEREEYENNARYSKLEAKLKNHSINCLSLCEKVDAYNDVELMTEQEIRMALLEWKDEWKKELESLNLRNRSLKKKIFLILMKKMN